MVSEFDDKVLVSRTMRRNTVFHEAPHQSPWAIQLRRSSKIGTPTLCRCSEGRAAAERPVSAAWRKSARGTDHRLDRRSCAAL